MKGVLIFCGGVLTGAAATIGALALISKKRNANNKDIEIHRDESWTEYTPEQEQKEEPKPVEEKETKTAMNENINIDISNQHNKLIEEYAEAHREEPERILEPWIMADDEWEESPYDKEYYTYFEKDQVLADDTGTMIADGRCGEDYMNHFDALGLVHVCNEELEVNFEIECDKKHTFEDLLLGNIWDDD